jgi:hypothetical protein
MHTYRIFLFEGAVFSARLQKKTFDTSLFTSSQSRKYLRIFRISNPYNSAGPKPASQSTTTSGSRELRQRISANTCLEAPMLTPPEMNAVLGGHTIDMKTAVSIPDEVYAEAERLSKHTKKSLSRLFSDAVAEYMARHDPQAVTAAMDRVCAESGNRDEFVASAARRTIEKCEW